MTGSRRRAARLVVAGASGLVVLLAAAVLSAGAAGLLVVLSTLAGAVALGLAIGLPGAPARPARRKPGPPVRDAPYRAYRQVAEQLSWAAVSPRHYDLMTRPMLVEIAAARLADRHGVDLYTQPAAACDLLGPDVWRWLDPTAVPTRDSQPPGVGRDVLRRVVERLERL